MHHIPFQDLAKEQYHYCEKVLMIIKKTYQYRLKRSLPITEMKVARKTRRYESR